MIESVWAPVVAALGASILTTGGLLLRDWLSRRKRRKTERLAAYESVLAQSMVVGQAAIALRLTMEFRSGLTEGLDIVLRYRQPLEPFDLADRLLDVFQPLFASVTHVWSRGTDDSIRLSNEIVDRCTELVRVATERGQAGSKLRRFLQGERWTEEQEERLLEAQRVLGESRRRLADLLREEGGEPRVDLLVR